MALGLSRALALSLLLVHGGAGSSSDEVATCARSTISKDGDAGCLLQLQMDPKVKLTEEQLNVSMVQDDHNSLCTTVFLTTVLGTRGDPVHTKRTPPSFAYFARYYRSLLQLPGNGVKAVVLHDFLPEELTSQYATTDGTFSFVKVNISRFDKHMSLNDLRYFLFEEQLKAHPEWDTVFMTDASDVTVLHNPCALVARQPEKIFVHSQGGSLTKHKEMKGKFAQLGGKYEAWLDALSAGSEVTVLNAGIQGGKRSVMLNVLAKLNAVLQDPELHVRKKHGQVNVNMAAVNYVYHTSFPDAFVTGYPLHSKWLRHEDRTDVYFKHK